VMEGDSAVMALFSAELEKLKQQGKEPSAEMKAEMERVRAKYEGELDAKYAAARGFVDAIIHPEDTRKSLELALRACLHNPGPHLGVFVLPQNLA